MKMKKLSGLIIGGGSIGQRHIFNLLKLGEKNISIYDNNEIVSKNISKKFNIPRFVDFESALSSNPDFCFICTFPSSHVNFSKKCLLNNSHVFIEKPLSRSKCAALGKGSYSITVLRESAYFSNGLLEWCTKL